MPIWEKIFWSWVVSMAIPIGIMLTIGVWEIFFEKVLS